MGKNRKQKLPPDDVEQSERFTKDAKQLEVDETGELFEKVFSIVASSVPKTGFPRPEDEV